MRLSFRSGNRRSFLRSLAHTLAAFALLLVSGIVLMSALNLATFNSAFFPLKQYLPIFSVIWKDNPWAALQVIADKSLLALGHFDKRSGLYLWTLEFNALSLLVYGAVAAAGVTLWRQVHKSSSCIHWVIGFIGLACLLIATTYATVLAHCAGPTWIGFVALYGLGRENFPLSSVWQWMFTLGGLGLWMWADYLRRSSNDLY